MNAPIDLYNRALSRIGIDQFLEDPNETSKSGSLFRLWYDTCLRNTLTDAWWNFATRAVALAMLDGDPPPGWQFKYGYPTDCLQARVVCDQDGSRTYLSTVFSSPPCWPQINDWCGQPQQPVPFVVMSEPTGTDSSQRILCTDLDEAYLLYTAYITDPNQFSDGFSNALAWRIASEIAGPFLGAPTGVQVAASCGKYYRDALMTAASQTLNESGQDYRPESPAVATRY